MSDDLTLLETDRLVLGGWRPDQIEDLYRLHGDPVVARYLTEHGQPWTKEQMDKSLASWIDLFERQKMGKLRVTRYDDLEREFEAFVWALNLVRYKPSGTDIT